jgi:phosphopantothenoylcysteine decarboxylase
MSAERGNRATSSVTASSVHPNDEMEGSDDEGCWFEPQERAPRVLVCFTGSVASVKAHEVVQSFINRAFDVRVIVTDVAKRFVEVEELRRRIRASYDEIEAEVGGINYLERFQDGGHGADEPFVYTDDTEWRAWREIGDPVTHIELRKWADILLVAPLSANTLAKMANGLCDNLLTCVWRAWDFAHPEKAVFVAPAMNTAMWNSPFTGKHLAVLSEFPNVHVIDPVEKTLACGDTGIGAMASPKTILRAVCAFPRRAWWILQRRVVS